MRTPVPPDAEILMVPLILPQVAAVEASVAFTGNGSVRTTCVLASQPLASVIRMLYVPGVSDVKVFEAWKENPLLML